MLHARKDYQRIQDPENKIGEEEPVFLVRAKDRFAVNAMRAWYYAAKTEALTTDNKSLLKMADLIGNHINDTINWQHENGCRIPDM